MFWFSWTCFDFFSCNEIHSTKSNHKKTFSSSMISLLIFFLVKYLFATLLLTSKFAFVSCFIWLTWMFSVLCIRLFLLSGIMFCADSKPCNPVITANIYKLCASLRIQCLEKIFFYIHSWFVCVYEYRFSYKAWLWNWIMWIVCCSNSLLHAFSFCPCVLYRNPRLFNDVLIGWRTVLKCFRDEDMFWEH